MSITYSPLSICLSALIPGSIGCGAGYLMGYAVKAVTPINGLVMGVSYSLAFEMSYCMLTENGYSKNDVFRMEFGLEFVALLAIKLIVSTALSSLVCWGLQIPISFTASILNGAVMLGTDLFIWYFHAEPLKTQPSRTHDDLVQDQVQDQDQDNITQESPQLQKVEISTNQSSCNVELQPEDYKTIRKARLDKIITSQATIPTNFNQSQEAEAAIGVHRLGENDEPNSIEQHLRRAVKKLRQSDHPKKFMTFEELDNFAKEEVTPVLDSPTTSQDLPSTESLSDFDKHFPFTFWPFTNPPEIANGEVPKARGNKKIMTLADLA